MENQPFAKQRRGLTDMLRSRREDREDAITLPPEEQETDEYTTSRRYKSQQGSGET